MPAMLRNDHKCGCHVAFTGFGRAAWQVFNEQTMFAFRQCPDRHQACLLAHIGEGWAECARTLQALQRVLQQVL